MRRMIIISLLITVGILAIVGGGAYWFYNNYNFYTTDDAQVSGPIISLSSPQAGTLTTFSAKIGDTVTTGQTVATITTLTATGQSAIVNVTSPTNGTIVQSSAVQGQNVSPGLALVQVADLGSLQIVAYVDEGQINNVKSGQDVDIHIDAYSGSTYNGHIQRIVQATAGSFSLLPSSDPTSGNFTKVGQRIPVLITLEGTGGNDIVPGMSAEVTIHLH